MIRIVGWSRALGYIAVLALSQLAPIASPVHATSYVRMSDADLADQTPVIAEVRVLDEEPGLSPSTAAGLPSTHYQTEILQVLKGHLPASRIAVRVPGGESADGSVLEVHGAPALERGERALLFLSPRDDGTWDPMHLMLGVFHLVGPDDAPMAVRDLSEAHEVELPDRMLPPEPPGTVRDFERFASWLTDRAHGIERPADYRIDLPTDGLRRTFDPFVLFPDNGQCSDGQRLSIRWTKFDAGQSARWLANSSGQPGMSGGGFAALQRAMEVWENDPDSNIRFAYQGTTSASSGTGSADGLIVFDDPHGDIAGTFDCQTGGVLAVGGPSFSCQPKSYRGVSYREAVAGRIITQNGAGCYFGSDNDKNGEEVFAHELGHTLGLAHSLTPGALMRASAYGDGRGASLAQDDRNAIAVLYGDGGSGSGPVQPQTPQPPSDLIGTPESASRIRLIWSDRSFDEDRFEIQGHSASGSFQTLGSVGAGSTAANVVGLQAGTTYTFRVRACNAAGCSSASNLAIVRTWEDDSGPSGNPNARCSPDPSVLCLADNRFAVEVDWKNPRQPGNEGVGSPVEDSDDSGFFWFFDPANLELVVKVLDGRGLNNHFWFFYGALSDVEYDIRVTDRHTGEIRVYRNEAGNICGQGDVQAFFDSGSASTTPAETDPAAAGFDEVHFDGVEVLAALGASTCADNPEALCLLDGRFEVTVDWVNPRVAGDSGEGTPMPRTDNTGTFWFFDPANLELVVKMLDGRPVNGKFWFFYGALSDVEYTLRVRDRVTGATRLYHNPAGEICGRGDVAAF